MMNSELKQTAYHEAGHQVVAFLQGMEIKGVTIIPYDEYIGCSYHDQSAWSEIHFDYDGELNPEEEKYLKQEALISLAGPISESIFKKEDFDAEQQDFQDALNCMDYIEDTFQNSQELINVLFVKADRMLRENWVLVESLANELYQHKKLNGKKVTEILNHNLG